MSCGFECSVRSSNRTVQVTLVAFQVRHQVVPAALSHVVMAQAVDKQLGGFPFTIEL